MRARHDAARLSGGWAQLVGMFGRLERVGEPFVRQAGDYTLVVPVTKALSGPSKLRGLISRRRVASRRYPSRSRLRGAVAQ